MSSPDLSPTRFNTQYLGTQRRRYPNPFFDIGSTYLPTSIKALFEWCEYYFKTNPLIHAVIYKRAEYPITDVIVEEHDDTERKYWETVLRKRLKIKTFLLEAGLDKGTYGNCFVQMFYPFKKYLRCDGCSKTTPIEHAKYKWVNLKFRLTCRCGTTSYDAKVQEVFVKDVRGIRLIRLNPRYVTPEYNEVTGDTRYYLDVPPKIRNDLVIGRKHILETLPQIYIEAVREEKALLVEKTNFFHLKRPTIAQKDMGFGSPLLLPVLKDAYYAQVLRKAQESVANNHILPLKIIFPQAAGASSDPYSSYSLTNWQNKIQEELVRWRQDSGYIPILPVPVGHELVGGEGKALMLVNELRQVAEWIVAGMQTPSEFIFGGSQYSSSNIAMRNLENAFLKEIEENQELTEWVLSRVAAYVGKKAPKVRFADFKMADDLQRVGLLFNMNQAQKISDRTLLASVDLDLETEEGHKNHELTKQLESQRRSQVAMAEIQGEVASVQMKQQVLSQAMQARLANPQPPVATGPQGPDGQIAGLPDGTRLSPQNAQEPPEGVPQEIMSPLTAQKQQGGMNLLYVARQAAAALEKMEDVQKSQALQEMSLTNPELHRIVQQILMSRQGAQTSTTDPLQMPMPDQKPPRRLQRV